MKLLVIGCGNMGGAIIRAVLEAQEPGERGRLFESVAVVDPSKEKMATFKERGCEVATSLEELRDGAMAGANTMVVLAVKPQDVNSALAELKKSWEKPDGTTQSAGSFLVSIAAGVSMDRLIKGLGGDGSGRGGIAVVRVMPNTPAQIGLGASGWMAAQSDQGGAVLSVEQQSAVVALLDLLGVSVEVSSEDELDAVTALSGSGPAYVFYFIEALVEGAEKLGLPREAAMRLAVQTVKGAAALAEGGEARANGGATLEGLKNLRAQVTSKGGTTEQAVGVLEEAGFKAMVHAAMRAAYERAKGMR